MKLNVKLKNPQITGNSLMSIKNLIWHKIYNKFCSIFLDSQNSRKDLDKHENLTRLLFSTLIIALSATLTIFIADIIFHSLGKDFAGTFGDFFGGILNPIFTFLTFFGLLITIVIQRMELRLAREEYEKTSTALTTQAIETTFFNTLTLHHKIVDGLIFDPSTISKTNAERRTNSQNKKTKLALPSSGRPVFRAILREAKNKSSDFTKVHSFYKVLQVHYNHVLGHYFRNLYQALKFIDSYDEDELSSLDKKKYTGMLRAQLSADELICLFLNCLDEMVDQGQFRNLLIRYQILEHAPVTKKGDIYFSVGSGVPLGDEKIFNQYFIESPEPTHPKEEINFGAFGKNPNIKI